MRRSRRDFIKSSLVAIAAAPVALLYQHEALAAKCKKTDVDPKLTPLKGLDSKKPDQLATNFAYYEDAKKVDVKKYEKRKGAEGKKQFCDNCNFYQPCKVADKKWGGCQVIPAKSVKDKAWCNLWTKTAS